MSTDVSQSIIVAGSANDVYAVWSNFENFPYFMQNIETVRILDGETSHWVMSGPMGLHLDWRAITTMNQAGERIAWRSTDESRMKTSGQVTFNELSNGTTEVTVTLHYEPPAGTAGEMAAAIFSNPEETLKEDLRNFKNFFEKNQQRAI